MYGHLPLLVRVDCLAGGAGVGGLQVQGVVSQHHTLTLSALPNSLCGEARAPEVAKERIRREVDRS